MHVQIMLTTNISCPYHLPQLVCYSHMIVCCQSTAVGRETKLRDLDRYEIIVLIVIKDMLHRYR